MTQFLVIKYKTSEGDELLPICTNIPNNAENIELLSISVNRYESIKFAAQNTNVDTLVNGQWFNDYINVDKHTSIKPNIIHVQTGNVYKTLYEASSRTGVSYGALCNHLNHPQTFPSCKGHTFFRS